MIKDGNIAKQGANIMTTETRVLFNADCPICNAEICHYQAYAEDSGLEIGFDDLNSEALAAWNIDADTAARRLHVVHEGQVSAGIPAFLVLWKEMPRYRMLGKLVGLPGIRHLASIGYDYILAPLIYRRHLWRQKSGNTAL
jgi:predicted DCC family thiol-disulfide oxidoreductase YuxK